MLKKLLKSPAHVLIVVLLVVPAHVITMLILAPQACRYPLLWNGLSMFGSGLYGFMASLAILVAAKARRNGSGPAT